MSIGLTVVYAGAALGVVPLVVGVAGLVCLAGSIWTMVGRARGPEALVAHALAVTNQTPTAAALAVESVADEKSGWILEEITDGFVQIAVAGSGSYPGERIYVDIRARRPQETVVRVRSANKWVRQLVGLRRNQRNVEAVLEGLAARIPLRRSHSAQ